MRRCFVGITTAASTRPDLIAAIACAREEAWTDWTWLNSSSAYRPTATCSLPTAIVCPGGVSLTIATRGLVGPRERASPINNAIATG